MRGKTRDDNGPAAGAVDEGGPPPAARHSKSLSRGGPPRVKKAQDWVPA